MEETARRRARHLPPLPLLAQALWTPWGFSEALEQGVTIRKQLYALAPIVAGSAIRAARALVRNEQIDVVHAHWVVPNGSIAALTGAPLVVTLHGSDIAVAERSRFLGRAARWTFARAHAVPAPSTDLLERARALGALEVERIPWALPPRSSRTPHEWRCALVSVSARATSWSRASGGSSQ
jgi:Glycosyltransferase Family 4